MSEGYWSDINTEPKRAYRWTLNMGGVPQWICKKVSKPSFTVTETTHTYLNHKFYYPGRVEWNTITVTLADPLAPDAAATMIDIITRSGYITPTDPNNSTTMSKQSAVEALGQVSIHQLGPSGDIVETWELVNAWVKDVKLGELDYESDDMVDVELEIRYDYATQTKAGSPSASG